MARSWSWSRSRRGGWPEPHFRLFRPRIQPRDLRQIALDVADPGRPRWMRAQQLDLRALVRRGHLLPQRDAGLRVVAGAGGELQADQIGLGLVGTAELQGQ